MSQEHTINHLKSQGRNGDTELIHVSKNELKGLQEIMLAHGGSLTVNPSTGLPEAYNFGSILKTVAPIAIGAGLTAVSGGALSPLAAAMITGAGYGLATGDMQQGLVAGLGAWGGAGIGAGLAEAGGTVLAEQGAEQGAKIATEAAAAPVQATLPQGYNAATSGFTPAEMAQGSLNPANYAQLQQPNQIQAINATNFPNLSQPQIQGFQGAIPNAANPTDITRAAGMANATQGAGASYPGMMKAGLGQMGTGQFISNNYAPMLASLVPALATQSTQPQYGTGSTYTAGANTMRLSPNFKGYTPPPPEPYYRDRIRYGAEGGLMAVGGQAQDQTQGQNQMYPGSQQVPSQYATSSQAPISSNVINASYEPKTDSYTGEMRLAPGGAVYLPKSPDVSLSKFTDTDPDTANKDALTATMLRLQKLGKSSKVPITKLAATNVKRLGDIDGDTAAAGGGLSHLGSYSDGGRLLKGPGDGVSDSIPAQIGSKQPARLADGEFVIPARIVSEIGNGSTDAGARKLYAMMDRVQKKRRTTKNVAANTKADKYLPA
jgi:hypothetical protein